MTSSDVGIFVSMECIQVCQVLFVGVELKTLRNSSFFALFPWKGKWLCRNVVMLGILLIAEALSFSTLSNKGITGVNVCTV